MFPTIDSHGCNISYLWLTSLQCSSPSIHIITVFPMVDLHCYVVCHHWFHITTMFPTIDFTSRQCSPPLISHHYNVPHHVLHHWFHIMMMFPTMFSTIGFTSWRCSPPCSPPLDSHHDNVPHHVPHHWFTSQVELAEWKEEEHLSQLGKTPNKAPEQDMRPGSSWLGRGYIPMVVASSWKMLKLLVKSVNEWKF
jgi:hypothetical protein